MKQPLHLQESRPEPPDNQREIAPLEVWALLSRADRLQVRARITQICLELMLSERQEREDPHE